MAAADQGARTTRRRGEELAAAIRAAVRDELAERGYPNLTFEGVAKRARTSKPVVYRRYSSRAHMVMDAWTHDPPADTLTSSAGTLREDLLALGRAFSDRFEAFGVDTVRSLLAEVSPQEAERLADLTTAWVPARLAAILDAARDRGEVGPGALSPRVQSLPLILARHELLQNDSLNEATLVDIMDSVCLPLFTLGARRDSLPAGQHRRGTSADDGRAVDDRTSPAQDRCRTGR